MTARNKQKLDKGKSPTIRRWLKWAKLRYLPARCGAIEEVHP